MARIYDVQTNYTSGELSPDVRSRVDLEQYYNGAQRMRNVLPIPTGGFQRRPGSQFTGISFTETDTNFKLMGFTTDVGQYQILLLHDSTIKVYSANADGTLTEEASAVTGTVPYLEAEIPDVNWVQYQDRIFMVHGNHEPQELIRTDASTWTIGDLTINNMPKFEFPFDLTTGGSGGGGNWIGYEAAQNQQNDITATINFADGGAYPVNASLHSFIINGQETELINPSGTQATYETNVKTAIGNLKNFASTDIAMVLDGGGDSYWSDAGGWGTVELTVRWEWQGAYAGKPVSMQVGILGNANATTTINEGYATVVQKAHLDWADVWSDDAGWPRAVAVYENRLVFASTDTLPNGVWMSKPGVFEADFDSEFTEDVYAIEAYSAERRGLSFIQDIYPGRHLHLFGSSAEFFFDTSDPLTPKNAPIRRYSARGSESEPGILEVDGSAYFVQKGGRAIRKAKWSDELDTYQTEDEVSLLASHLMNNPSSWAFRKAQANDEVDYIAIIMADGTIAALTVVELQNVRAWCKWETDGTWEAITAIEDELYTLCKRTINAVETFTIERFDSNFMMDMATGDYSLTSPMTQIAASWALWTDYNDSANGFLIDGYWVGDPQTFTSDGATSKALANATDSAGPWPFADYYELRLQGFDQANFSWEYGLLFPDVKNDTKITTIDRPQIYVKDMPITIDPDGPQSRMGQKKRIFGASVIISSTSQLLVNEYNLLSRHADDALDKVGSDSGAHSIVQYTGEYAIKGLPGYSVDAALEYTQTRPVPCRVVGATRKVSY